MSYPNVLLVVGAVFLIIGLVAIFKTKWGEIIAPNRPARVIFSLVGVALIVASVVSNAYERAQQQASQAAAQERPSPLALASPQPQQSERTPASASPLTSKADPEKLIEIIKREQEAEVGKSYNDYDNFGDDDSAAFKTGRKHEAVVKRPENDGAFIDIVVAVRGLDGTSRQKLLERGAGKYKKTWSQLHKVTPEGQTEAGQTAERMIAEKIVEKVKELVKKPDAELRKLSP